MNTSIRIVIAALGGEGGGVLGKWIADMAARCGYLSQSTSVPGVAQRTGATIYYIEIFPREEAEAAGRSPVMSMFPTPGDVDIVICSEIVEAGRMIQRGFVTPQRTVLLSSTHRTYGIAEKEALGNGIADKDAIAAVARSSARKFIGFDMLEVSRRFDSVINAALFGALAASSALPFERGDFEETIRLGKIAVERNLQSFAASYEQAWQQCSGVRLVEPAAPVQPSSFSLPAGATTEGKQLLRRIEAFPRESWEMLYLGVKKLIDYQDHAYAGLYLSRVEALRDAAGSDDASLLSESARFLALWMAFEDLPRVAQLKISPERFARFREEVRAEPDQQVAMVEFLHPRVEEFCAAMPAGMGRYMLASPLWSKMLGFFARPRNVRTNSLRGYLLLYVMAWYRRFRRGSLAYQIEQGHIEQWLAQVSVAAARDRAFALELARCGRLIKGYGSTRERGIASLQRILALCEQEPALASGDAAALREAALADDQGIALDALEGKLRCS